MRPPAVDKRSWGLVIAIPQLSQSSGLMAHDRRQSCAEAKLTHGNETRKARSDRSEAMCPLRGAGRPKSRFRNHAWAENAGEKTVLTYKFGKVIFQI